jgi:hypothetical protein
MVYRQTLWVTIARRWWVSGRAEAVERYNRIVEYGVRYWQSRKPVK